MGSIIFVHGTGVRQAGYEKTFKILESRWSKKKDEFPDFTLMRCVWGEVFGARLLNTGASIPGYAGKATETPSDEVVKWWLLYQDPLIELRSLREKSFSEIPPGKRTEWDNKKKEVKDYKPSVEFQEVLKEAGLDQLWQKAFSRITAQSDEWKETLPGKDETINQFYPVFCRCTADAVMAETSLRALAAGVPAPTSELRNDIVRLFLSDLGATVRGDWDLLGYLGIAARRVALRLYAAGDYFFSEIVPISGRNMVTDNFLPFPGDILYYQARGEKLREFIEKRVNDVAPPVFLLAHSLGGIACVELLIEKDMRSKVAGLITAGSQAPLFYEMNCLVKCPRDEKNPGSPLPDHFPPWLNFHDPNDYLSYAAKEIFKSDKIADEMIVSRQPHLMAHSAYWSEKKLWDRVAGFIRDNQNSAG